MESAQFEPGSFRDREGRVLVQDDHIYRLLKPSAQKDWEQVSRSEFFQSLMSAGKIVRTQVCTPEVLSALSKGDPRWALALEHERVPVISYPYEWSFSMLKDAALLQLEILAAALEENCILKDGSAYNVQFVGPSPVFIDVGSICRWEPGEVWAGYRQFCEMMLFPLLLQSYRGLSLLPWLRGALEGVGVADACAMLSLRDWIRPGVFTHVVLQNMLQRKYSGTQKNVRAQLRSLEFGIEIIKANVQKLTRLIRRLVPPGGVSEWSEYAGQNSYASDDTQLKKDFVQKAIQTRRRKVVWDLGGNTGVFSRVAASQTDTVVCMDFDSLAVDKMYHALKAEGVRNVLPLVMNVANMSPNQGWRAAERKDLSRRARPDLIMALALIHHVVISAHVPLEDFVAWLAESADELVIEFVSRADPMVQTLLRNKEDLYDDYDQEVFERCMNRHYQIIDRKPILAGNRTLYYAKVKR